MANETYQVFALRYATVQRSSSENFLGGDPGCGSLHSGPSRLSASRPVRSKHHPFLRVVLRKPNAQLIENS